jgi:hypothetical protein
MPKTWIFQGNSNRYDLDAYLGGSPEYAYWRAPKLYNEIEVGHRACIWRSGPEVASWPTKASPHRIWKAGSGSLRTFVASDRPISEERS